MDKLDQLEWGQLVRLQLRRAHPANLRQPRLMIELIAEQEQSDSAVLFWFSSNRASGTAR